MSLHSLENGVLAAGQISPAAVQDLARAGAVLLVSHRPDHEEPGQPSAAAMEAAARAAGIDFVHAPVRGLPDEAAVAATAQALERAGPGRVVVLFCRSGMRSAAAWAMARTRQGADPDELRAAAAEAGFDLSRLPL